jgi:hypothetical protein
MARKETHAVDMPKTSDVEVRSSLLLDSYQVTLTPTSASANTYSLISGDLFRPLQSDPCFYLRVSEAWLHIHLRVKSKIDHF